MTNEKEVQVYKEYSKKFRLIARTIDLHTLFRKAEESVVREELCSGSDMFIGYYSPSIVEDIVVGNVHRGRLLTRITKRSKPTHRYGFDQDGRLRTVVEIPGEGMEHIDYRAVLVYEGNSIIIVRFRVSELPDIFAIAECLYDDQNRLFQYTVGAENSNDRFRDIYQEHYTYSERGLEGTTLLSYISYPQIDKFRFIRDNEGNIDAYQLIGDEYWKDKIWELSKEKRKNMAEYEKRNLISHGISDN